MTKTYLINKMVYKLNTGTMPSPFKRKKVDVSKRQKSAAEKKILLRLYEEKKPRDQGRKWVLKKGFGLCREQCLLILMKYDSEIRILSLNLLCFLLINSPKSNAIYNWYLIFFFSIEGFFWFCFVFVFCFFFNYHNSVRF